MFAVDTWLVDPLGVNSTAPKQLIPSLLFLTHLFLVNMTGWFSSVEEAINDSNHRILIDLDTMMVGRNLPSR